MEQHGLQPGGLGAYDQHPLVRDVQVVSGLTHQLRGLDVGAEGEHLLVILLQTVVSFLRALNFSFYSTKIIKYRIYSLEIIILIIEPEDNVWMMSYFVYFEYSYLLTSMSSFL